MALPPLQPSYVLRGHAAQVHALQFSYSNSFLLSGDAEGYVVCWSLASKRATASWRAHTNAVLGLAWWTDDVVVTHGRDSQLHIWKLRPGLDIVLPVDRHASPDIPVGKTPHAVHSMTVNTLNFCSFAWISNATPEADHLSYLLALPHTLSSETIDVFQITFSSQETDEVVVNCIRKTTIPAPSLENPRTGLVMCLDFHRDSRLLAGYESGHAIVYDRVMHENRATAASKANAGSTIPQSWQYQPSYISRPHTEPILSISGLPFQDFCITTAADAKLVTHRIPSSSSQPNHGSVIISEAFHSLNTKHSGQQGLSIRNDGLLLATAGWDAKGRVYRAPSQLQNSDGVKFSQAKEIAVLKWHKEGCYCTAFAHVQKEEPIQQKLHGVNGPGDASAVEQALALRGSSVRTLSVAQRREHGAKTTHWLALGSKDAKISLWNIP